MSDLVQISKKIYDELVTNAEPPEGAVVTSGQPTAILSQDGTELSGATTVVVDDALVGASLADGSSVIFDNDSIAILAPSGALLTTSNASVSGYNIDGMTLPVDWGVVQDGTNISIGGVDHVITVQDGVISSIEPAPEA